MEEKKPSASKNNSDWDAANAPAFEPVKPFEFDFGPAIQPPRPDAANGKLPEPPEADKKSPAPYHGSHPAGLSAAPKAKTARHGSHVAGQNPENKKYQAENQSGKSGRTSRPGSGGCARPTYTSKSRKSGYTTRPGSEDYTPPAYTNQSGKSLTGASVPATLGTIFFTAIFISIGAVFLGIFGIRQYLKSTYDPVSAQVVGYNSYESSNDDGGYTTMYRAIFEYTYNGRTYRKSDSVSSSSPGSDVGEYKTVYVNPANPVEIITNSEQVIFLILGIVFFVVGWLPLILYIRANKRSRR